MKSGPSLVIRGTILGSLLLATLAWLLSAHIDLTPAPHVAMAASANPTLQVSVSIEASDEPQSSPECQVSSAYPASILQWCAVITEFADQHALPPNLVAAVMLQESGGDAEAYSSSGAVGLMQVMPRDGLAAEFQCLNGPCFASRPTIDELLEPEFNVDYGSRMLAGLIARLGSTRDALKSYGPMDVGYRYADTVLAIYDRYR